jgi:hypothetical protein
MIRSPEFRVEEILERRRNENISNLKRRLSNFSGIGNNPISPYIPDSQSPFKINLESLNSSSLEKTISRGSTAKKASGPMIPNFDLVFTTLERKPSVASNMSPTSPAIGRHRKAIAVPSRVSLDERTKSLTNEERVYCYSKFLKKALATVENSGDE